MYIYIYIYIFVCFCIFVCLVLLCSFFFCGLGPPLPQTKLSSNPPSPKKSGKKHTTFHRVLKGGGFIRGLNGYILGCLREVGLWGVGT